MRQAALACTSLTLLLVGAAPLAAQSVRGLGDDALTAPRGAIRIQMSTSIADVSERYGKGTPGRSDGALEPLGVDFSVDTLGVRLFPGLASLQTAIRSLTGNGAFTLSLGRSQLSSSVRVQTTPIALEAGITNRLSLGVLVPVVTARNQVSLNVNSGANVGNMSFNPARVFDTSVVRNTQLIDQLTTARTQLEALIASCTANPGSNANCGSVIASAPAVAATATTFTAGIAAVYGTTGSNGASFVPLAGSAADSVILNRVGTLRTQFQQFGITALAPTTTGPSRPSAPITPDGLQSVLPDTALGLLAAPLGTITRQGLGDIEVAVKLRLFDAFGTRSDTMRFVPRRGLQLRQSLAGVYRFGTGTIDQPDDYLDVGTGHGQNDVELRSFTDLVYGRRFFASVIGRYTVQLADQQPLRITDAPDLVFAPAYRERLVDRDLGDQLEIEFTPRWIMNDFFSIGAQYLFRSRAEDTYRGTFTVPTSESGLDAPLELDANSLRFETAGTEQRVGFGLTFSSVAAHARGKAKLPIELQYFNSRTIAGSGGNVWRLSIHQVQIRLYPKR
ncbi:MAG: hypothetical protein U5K74_05035 [Gemmatimonadaceae bacterium]|nr:hypothetical protein [Gemmatimonadaceae bacterium]